MKCVRCETFLQKEKQYIDTEGYLYNFHHECMLEYMQKVMNIIDEKCKITKEFRNKLRANVYKEK